MHIDHEHHHHHDHDHHHHDHDHHHHDHCTSDCGSCGSPTCRTFAEDIVRGYAGEMDCIHILRDKLKVMAQQMVELAQTKRE